MPEIWVVSLQIFTIYSIYCGLTYFIPFLKDIYHLPVALIGAYGIINQYGLKMIGGPIGGIVSDKVVGSSARFLRYAIILSTTCIILFMFLPHESMNVYVGMVFTLGYGVIVFSMRAVFFAPVDEIKIPKEISGAAMSIACLIGYAPQIFLYAVFGHIIDVYEGLSGYNIIFSLMACFGVLAFVVNTLLIRMIEKRKDIVLD